MHSKRSSENTGAKLFFLETYCRFEGKIWCQANASRLGVELVLARTLYMKKQILATGLRSNKDLLRNQT